MAIWEHEVVVPADGLGLARWCTLRSGREEEWRPRDKETERNKGPRHAPSLPLQSGMLTALWNGDITLNEHIYAVWLLTAKRLQNMKAYTSENTSTTDCFIYVLLLCVGNLHRIVLLLSEVIFWRRFFIRSQAANQDSVTQSPIFLC